MDQDFYYEETSPKNAKLMVLGIVVVFVLICVGLYLYRAKYTLHIKKGITYEVGSTISEDIHDFVDNKIVDENDYTLLLAGVNMDDNVLNKVGEYTFKVKYKNVTKSGKIKVVDTKAPTVEVQELTVGVDEEYLVDDFIKVCDDYSKPCNVDYEKESDKNLNKKAGNYNFNIVIADAENNKVTKEVSLIVKSNYSYEAARKNDLHVDHIDPNLEDFDGTLILKFSEAYDPNEFDETDAYGEFLEITSEDHHNYLDPLYYNNAITEEQIAEAYNKYGYLVGYAIRVKLDNGLYFYLKNQ